MSNAKYAVKFGDKWHRVNKGQVTSKGWLHYELREGTTLTIGLAQPKNWSHDDTLARARRNSEKKKSKSRADEGELIDAAQEGTTRGRK